MAKNKKKTSIVTATLLSFLVSSFAIYMIFSVIESITLGESLFQRFISYEGKKEAFLTLNYEYKILSVVFFLLFFMGLFTLLRRDASGYKDAAWHGAYGNAVFSYLEHFRSSGYVAMKNKSKWNAKNPYVALSASEGIILGREKDELMIIPPDSKLDNRNVLVVGSSGSSKGQAFVINNIINNRSSSIVVTDPKGELYKLTSEIKRDQGFKVYQIDFLNLVGDGYNPLDYIEDDLDAKRVALTIARNSAKDDKEDHWFSKGVELLTGLILYVKSEYKNPSIPVEVKREFNRANEDEDYLKELCETIGEEHIAYAYLKDASVAKGNERQSIFSTFTKHVGIFSSKKVAELTKVSDFKFDFLQDEISILYIKIPIKDNPVAALTATFFDQLISRMYSIGDLYDAKLPIPLIALFDEFANIGKLNEFDNTLSTCRGYDFSIITIVQDFAQLEKNYGKENSRTIISNHDTTLFLRTKDTETAKYFESLAGDTTITYTTTGQSTSGMSLLPIPGNTSSSKNQNIVKKPLISQSQLLQMPADACYAFLAGRVIELEKAYQALIYKDFITSTETVVVNGIKRHKFPYVYPKNRDEYIKRFNLIPRAESTEDAAVNEETVKTVQEVKESTPHNIEQPQIQKTSTNTLNQLIDDFMLKTEMTTIENEMKAEYPAKQIVEEEPTNEISEVEKVENTFTIKEAIEITDTMAAAKKEEFNQTSDPSQLAELKEIINFNSLAKSIETVTEELSIVNEISELLDVEEDISVLAAVETTVADTTEEPPSAKEETEDSVQDNKQGQDMKDLLPF
ncbi:type IV secretory system conjugative DNA transfer family protein [Solibacillus sp. FSL W7-1436]|uniref:VirD4-like conjugal transfer protein, CD1115 family n=1 Tax=Solibacillus sp. FSL W7-1436 TaxID=2921705 RepID=UPI0030F6D9D6